MTIYYHVEENTPLRCIKDEPCLGIPVGKIVRVKPYSMYSVTVCFAGRRADVSKSHFRPLSRIEKLLYDLYLLR